MSRYKIERAFNLIFFQSISHALLHIFFCLQILVTTRVIYEMDLEIYNRHQDRMAVVLVEYCHAGTLERYHIRATRRTELADLPDAGVARIQYEYANRCARITLSSDLIVFLCRPLLLLPTQEFKAFYFY